MRAEVLAGHVAETLIRYMTPIDLRVKALEQRIDAVHELQGVVGELRELLAVLEARDRTLEARSQGDAEIGALRTRVAELEGRAALPGPAGPTGPAGPPGADGRSLEYRGVYVEGAIYERGDLVSVAGSMWHCDADTTSRPGNGNKDWTLAVKRGADKSGPDDRERR